MAIFRAKLGVLGVNLAVLGNNLAIKDSTNTVESANHRNREKIDFSWAFPRFFASQDVPWVPNWFWSGVLAGLMAPSWLWNGVSGGSMAPRWPWDDAKLALE